MGCGSGVGFGVGNYGAVTVFRNYRQVVAHLTYGLKHLMPKGYRHQGCRYPLGPPPQ
jgi:hypothetical protein